MLSSAAAVCQVFSLIIAGNPIFYSGAPVGTCNLCCELIEREAIKFLLYTRQNPTQPQHLYLSDTKRLKKSNFNFNNPLAIYLHGFSESATGFNQSSQQIKDAFLNAGNYNVILIDWSPITAAPWYVSAVEHIPETGRYIARFIRYLKMKGYSSQQMHLVGFSLGAEVSGFVGNQLKEWDIELPRITGLDPPRPLFEDDPTKRVLSSQAAKFVDIIHTDHSVLGNPEAMGHADFYPNKDRPLQPGCPRLIATPCSHQRAWEYFIESLQNPYAFKVSKCEPTEKFAQCQSFNGKAFMGMAADSRLRGKFLLTTNSEAPYGRYKMSNVARRSTNQQVGYG